MGPSRAVVWLRAELVAFSTRDIARKVGVSAMAISLYSRELAKPGYENRRRFQEKYSLPPEFWDRPAEND